MSVQWFKKAMESGSLIVRVTLTVRQQPGYPQLEETPDAAIELYTGFVEDEVVWGGLHYSSVGNRPSSLKVTAWPMMQSPEECWRDTSSKWRHQPGWMQHKTVVCRIQRADKNTELQPSHLLVLEHLSRLSGMLYAGERGELGFNHTLAHRLNGLITAQNRVWRSMTSMIR